jgi:hypothetical protein
LYILPIVPAEAALIGALIARTFAGPVPVDGSSVLEGPVRWSLLAAAAGLLLAGAATFWIFGVSHQYSLRGVAVAGAIAALGGIAASVASVRRKSATAAALVAGALVAISWCLVLGTLPDFERYKPVRPFAAMIRSRASIGAIVGYYRFALPSMVYYLNRPVMEVVLPDHLRAVFYSSSDIYFVMPESEYEAIKNRLPVETFVLARQQMFDLRPKNFLDGSELQQFVLISNRADGTR